MGGRGEWGNQTVKGTIIAPRLGETLMPVNHPNIEPITDKLYRLERNFSYTWKMPWRKKGSVLVQRIIIPKGFLYDGASVPRLVWTISGIRPDGLIRAAALVHDYLYRHKGILPEGKYLYLNSNKTWHNLYTLWNRKLSDKLFIRIMREAGMKKYKRRIAYIAVRIFGKRSW